MNYGNYEVNGRKTFSKMEACEYSNRNASKIKFMFNDEIYDAYDWKKEPVKNLNQLYLERALELRSKYEYLILMYSGGSDSHNVLMTFLENDIKIDEVCTYWMGDIIKNPLDLNNIEQIKHTWPTLKKIKEKYPNLNVKRIDMGGILLKMIENNQLSENYEYETIHTQSFCHRVKGYFKEYILRWKDLLSVGKNICLIYGQEKPFLQFENNKYFLTFPDLIGSLSGRFSVFNYTPGYDEQMFYSYENPDIVIKQAHIIKNYLNSLDVNSPLLYNKKPNNTDCFQEKRTRKWINRNVGINLIYDTWSNDYWQLNKPVNILYKRPHNSFLFENLSHNDDIKKFFSNCQYFLDASDKLDIIEKKTLYNKKQMPIKINTIWSKKYFLE